MPRTDATVLIADDMKTILSVEEGLFTSLGFRPILAESGTEALKLLLSNRVDIAFLDYYLEDMSGADVIRLYGEAENVHKTVFIAVTSDAEQKALECVKQGFSDILGKPMDKPGLIGILKKYI